MDGLEEILDLITQTQLRQSDMTKFKTMSIEELSQRLREAITYEQEISEELEKFEKKGASKDVIDYAKFVCKNSTQKQISAIQDAYLKELDRRYLRQR